VPLARSGVDGWKATSPRPAPGSRRAGEVDDAGFTLVEMLLVLLVMGILLAIAIPTFLGTTSAADDRSAQSNLVTAFTDAKSQFQENGQTYGDTAGLVGLLGEAQLDLQFKDGSTGPTIKLGSSGTLSDISVSVSSDGNGVVLGAYSVPGNCFYIVDNAQALAPPASSLDPYLGTAPGSRQPQSVHGAIGLPTAAGTFYVTVAGDQDKNDCNASTPSASGSGISAVYQTDGFAPGVST
jgi:type IV pilus assembly protein PilA